MLRESCDVSEQRLLSAHFRHVAVPNLNGRNASTPVLPCDGDRAPSHRFRASQRLTGSLWLGVTISAVTLYSRRRAELRRPQFPRVLVDRVVHGDDDRMTGFAFPKGNLDSADIKWIEDNFPPSFQVER